jgi:hypothetical protein
MKENLLARCDNFDGAGTGNVQRPTTIAVMTKPSVEQLVDPAFVSDLQSLDLDEIRRRREFCQDAEDSLSLQRRVVQGRLDIVQAELDVRAGGERAADLVGSLPGILGEHSERTPGPGRLLSTMPPDEAGPDLDELTARLDAIVGGARLSELSGESDESLRSMVSELGTIEHDLSGKRHQLHSHIDAIQAEIIRRYKTGEASVDRLLES